MHLFKRDGAQRERCLGYLMEEYRAFPENVNVEGTIDLFAMCCALAANTEMLSVIAATLANGGLQHLS